MKKGRYLTFITIALVLLLFLYMTFTRKKNVAQPVFDNQQLAEQQAIPVIVEKIQFVTMKETITAIGNIEPIQTAVVYPEATGILEKLMVEEGNFVEKGNLIAVIESQQRQLNVQQVEKEIKAEQYEIANLRQDYNRFKRLVEEGAVAVKKLEDIETLYKASEERIEGLKKQLEIAKRRLDDTIVKAPITGIVAEKFINEGELITENSLTKASPIVAIIDTSKVKITVPIVESDIKKIRLGQSVYVTTDAYPTVRFYGKIEKIMPLTDFVTRTTKVQILVDNPSRYLKPGLFTRVVIETGSRPILALPLDALMRLQGSGNCYCFRIDNNIVEKTYIDIGETYNGMVEIKNGLKAGDIVVVSSQGILETGKKVMPSYTQSYSK